MEFSPCADVVSYFLLLLSVDDCNSTRWHLKSLNNIGTPQCTPNGIDLGTRGVHTPALWSGHETRHYFLLHQGSVFSVIFRFLLWKCWKFWNFGYEFGAVWRDGWRWLHRHVPPIGASGIFFTKNILGNKYFQPHFFNSKLYLSKNVSTKLFLS